MYLYKIWAPENSEWSTWAKPILFAYMSHPVEPIQQIPFINMTLSSNTMIIVDLPGKEGVETSLAFAVKGYRPVPLYNGTMGDGSMLVDVNEICESIISLTDALNTMPISPEAPPVFMLDSNRMNGSRAPGYYDNRWCVFPQDMPSAEFLKDKGINNIIIYTNGTVQTDLERILYDYQKSGIALYVYTTGAQSPVGFDAKKQRLFSDMTYRFRVILGLKRNATGGFGGRVPLPYEHTGTGTGRFYYGHG